ncbi:hypothetical protein J2S43_001128 [Catenuloplanes nepalensis]|uniref:DNA-binding protein n=1 Tax=Catenuloplanes nepalensis TaxID=587533 RepID=A0ABT9MMR9_9ACTN|nr:hypothetical protein [Catenuloplanes nepalensis]MDP9792616.1 hypothetical protein [Catenuloplanes nepalensis]
MTRSAEAAPTSGRVRLQPDGRHGAVIGTVAGTDETTIEVLLDDGTTTTVSATTLTRPPHLAADPAGYTAAIAANERPATRVHPDEREAPALSDYLDALAGIQAYRRQVDQDELRLIDAARAAGATWQQIGLALGSDHGGAKQRGHRRQQALATRSQPA